MIPRAIRRASAAFAWIERLILMGLVLSIAGFVLTNVLLRMFGVTIAWADEIAVYAMILSGFVGASLMLRARIDPAVLLLHEMIPEGGRRILRGVVSTVALAFGGILLHLCWRWFDPLALIAAGFDVGAFEGATFNFVYTDTTPVMGVPAWYFYVIMPWFALTVTVHAATNLLEDLGLLPRPADPAGLAMEGASV